MLGKNVKCSQADNGFYLRIYLLTYKEKRNYLNLLLLPTSAENAKIDSQSRQISK